MKRTLFLGILVVFLFYTAGTAITRVQPGERAVVRRFGQIQKEKPAPGLYIGLPWGIDQVDRISVGMVRKVAVGFGLTEEETTTPAGQILTGDHNLVNVQAEIYYRVVEEEVEKFFLQQQSADALVARVTQTVLSEWIAGRPVDEVLLRGKNLLPRWLIAEVQERLRPYDLGVQIENASLVRLNPPEEVRSAFDLVAQAQTNIRTQINQAEQESLRKLQEAQAEAIRLQHLTTAYANEQKLQAKAEAENFTKRLAQYRQLSKDNPEYLNVLWLDEMTRLYAKMRETGRIDVLDHFLSSEGLNITQFPLLPKKK